MTAVLALVLPACGGEAEPQAAPEANATGSPGQAAAAGSQGPAAAARAAPAPRLQAAAGDLSNFSCTPRRGVWSARGVITNSAKEPMVYTVTVVTVAGTSVAGDDTDEFLLEPEETASFEFPGISQGPADSCMPRLVRAPR